MSPPRCCICLRKPHPNACEPLPIGSPSAFGLSRHTLGIGPSARWYWVREGRRYATIGELLAVEGSPEYRARWAA